MVLDVVLIMRIDRTTGFEMTAAAGKGKAPAGKSDKLDALHPAGQDTTEISTAADKYVARAMASDEVNAAAVAEAKRLIESGELDTPQAANRAAEAINSQGV